jgi:hypothetical protein
VSPSNSSISWDVLGALVAVLAARKAYRGISEQIDSGRESEHRARTVELTALYNAFAADLDALNKSLVGLRDALGGNAEAGVTESTFLASRDIVWEQNANKIGLLHPNHAANIIETYRFVDGLKGRAQKLDLNNPAHRDDLANLVSAAVSQIELVLSGLPVRPDQDHRQT